MITGIVLKLQNVIFSCRLKFCKFKAIGVTKSKFCALSIHDVFGCLKNSSAVVCYMKTSKIFREQATHVRSNRPNFCLVTWLGY